jgi:hypothetical protein
MLIKVGLELNFTFIFSITNGGCHLKNMKKISLMAEKIGHAFSNSTEKNQLFISDGSRVINLLMKPCNLAFLQKR